MTLYEVTWRDTSGNPHRTLFRDIHEGTLFINHITYHGHRVYSFLDVEVGAES